MFFYGEGTNMLYNLENNIAYKILEFRKAHKFVSNIDQIVLDITPILNEICIYFNNYTLHNIEHSFRVLYNMCVIAGKDNLEKLSDLELAMIIYAALLHDIGMWISSDEIAKIENSSQFEFYLKKNCGNKSLALQDYIRPIHGKRSYKYLMEDKKFRPFFSDSRLSTVSFLEDVALICQSHMENIDWINKNLKESFSKTYHYNSKYIALLLRIADYIDFDSQRAPQYLLEHKQINEFSFTEWKKHAVVCNLEKINEASKEIYFDIECDDFHLYCKLMDTFELMNKEVSECVACSKSFANISYHLLIKDKIQYNIVTKGFSPERFSFTLDYYKVTNLLMGENLYGDKRYGFRELLQNCFDACDVMKEYYLRHDPTANYEPQVSIIYDFESKTVVIKDNGTGMSKDIISKYFLTIGKSYYRSDEYEKLGLKINPTGTFGIGFLSCFMLSKKVTVVTKYYETGESSSFLLEKDSKYICYLDKSYIGVHGTMILLSMDEFNQVFTRESLLLFINENFYRLNTKVNIYNQEAGIITYKDQAKAVRLTQFLDIDLSPYLEGVECRANIVSILDEFKLYNSFLEVTVDDYNMVLFTLGGIRLISQELLCEHYKKRCTILYSQNSFEELIIQTYGGDQYIDTNIFDIDEIIDDFEAYGFKVFTENFNKYLEEYDENWSFDILNSEAKMPICVIWDTALKNDMIQDILQRTKMRYLYDIDALSKSFACNQEKGSNIINSNSLHEDYESDNIVLSYSYSSSFLTSYSTGVCYRGVLLNDVKLQIPYIANILSEVNVVANILSAEFIPSVTRRGLTEQQEQILSYAIGKAIHIYLLNRFSDDKDVTSALKNFLKVNYSMENLLCRYYDLD